MSMLGQCGLEYQSQTADGLIVIGGTMNYMTALPDPPPGGSVAYMATGINATIRRPWYSGDGATFNEPSGTNYVYHGHVYFRDSTFRNDEDYAGVGRGGVETITVSSADLTGMPTIRVAGVVVAVGTGIAFSNNTWERVIMKVDQQTGGAINVYFAGDLVNPVVSYILTAADLTALAGKPNEFWLHAAQSSQNYHDNWACIDPADGVGIVNADLLGLYGIAPQSPNGAGPDIAWVGTFADINAVPPDDGTEIRSTAINERSDFTHPALPVGTYVVCVQQTARVQRSGSVAGSQLQQYMQAGGVREDQTLRNAPLDGYVRTLYQEKVGGGAWGEASTAYDATTFGEVTRT